MCVCVCLCVYVCLCMSLCVCLDRYIEEEGRASENWKEASEIATERGGHPSAEAREC